MPCMTVSPASSVAMSKAPRPSARGSVAAEAYVPTTSSSRNQAADRSAPRRHPGQHHPATGPGGAQRGLERATAADRVDGRHRRRRAGRHRVEAAAPARNARVRPRVRRGAPQRARRRRWRRSSRASSRCWRVLGHHGDLAGIGELAQREGGEQPHRPGAAHQHVVAAADLRHGARCGRRRRSARSARPARRRARQVRGAAGCGGRRTARPTHLRCRRRTRSGGQA